MTKAQALRLDELAKGGRDTVAEREIKERDGTAKVDGRTLRKTGRSVQVMFRTSPDYRQRVLAIVDAHQWTVGQTLERAVEALERELKRKVGK